MDLKLFLEVPMRFNRDTQSFEPSYTGALQERRDSVLLFVKFFDPVQESLRFVGRLYITKKATVKECSALLCTVCGLQAMVDIEVYEEIKYEPTVNVSVSVSWVRCIGLGRGGGGSALLCTVCGPQAMVDIEM